MAGLLQILFIGMGVYPTCYPYLEENLSVAELKEKVRLLKKIKCATQDVRLFLAKKALHGNEWLTVYDPDVDQLIRFDYFRELAAKYTPPELEMRDGRLVSDYLNKRTMWPLELEQVHVVVTFPAAFVRVWCLVFGHRQARDTRAYAQAALREKAKEGIGEASKGAGEWH